MEKLTYHLGRARSALHNALAAANPNLADIHMKIYYEHIERAAIVFADRAIIRAEAAA